MEMFQREMRTNIKTIIFLIFPIFFLFGCGAMLAGKDKNGDRPRDMVVKLIKLIKEGKYEDAQKLYHGNCMIDTSLMTPPTFEEYSSYFKNIDLNKLKISAPKRGKSGWFVIEIDWDENGTPKHYLFGLKIVDGVWKFHRGLHF